MASITVSSMITNVLRRINVIQEGESASADLMADAFTRLNDWVSSVAELEKLTIYTVTRSTWTITSTKGFVGSPYTVGVSGDINIFRPPSMNFIDKVRYQDTSVSPTIEYRLQPLTRDAYQAIPQKTLTSPLPTMWFYEPTYTSSAFGSMYLWMVPTQASLQGVIYAPTPISEFTAISDTIALPPGYNRFIRDGLAVELWPELREGAPIDTGLQKSADDAKFNIKRANVSMMDLSFDPAILRHGGGIYDINSDTNMSRT